MWGVFIEVKTSASSYSSRSWEEASAHNHSDEEQREACGPPYTSEEDRFTRTFYTLNSTELNWILTELNWNLTKKFTPWLLQLQCRCSCVPASDQLPLHMVLASPHAASLPADPSWHPTDSGPALNQPLHLQLSPSQSAFPWTEFNIFNICNKGK